MRNHEKTILAFALAAFGSAAALGCNQVFGVDEAAVDPTFGADASGAGSDGGGPARDGGDLARDGGGSDVGARLDSGGGSDSGESSDAGDGGGMDVFVADAGALPISCDNYCKLVAAACTGPNLQYINDGVCPTYCTTAMDLGIAGQTSQDSVACRQYFAAQAAQGFEPATNCRNAGPVGGGACGSDPCADYCKLNVAICGPTVPAYADTAACITACHRWPFFPGVQLVNADTFNTLNCRDYHLQAVFELPGTPHTYHCHHTTDPSGTCSLDAGRP